MGQLDGKVAIVTGGGAGIGRGITLALAREGAHIAIADVDLQAAKRVVEQIDGLGSKGLAVKTDVSDNAEVIELGRAVIEAFGHIDVLVNNAGLGPPDTTFLDIAAGELDRVIAVNLKGPFFCSQMAVKHMIDGGRRGSIINISSTQGLMGFPLHAHYSATKGAIVALTRSLATELGELGIRVNAIAPGITMTERVAQTLQDRVRFIESVTPLKRPGRPEDYGAIAVFLASDGSSFLTGATIPVDGGLANCRLFGK